MISKVSPLNSNFPRARSRPGLAGLGEARRFASGRDGSSFPFFLIALLVEGVGDYLDWMCL